MIKRFADLQPDEAVNTQSGEKHQK